MSYIKRQIENKVYNKQRYPVKKGNGFPKDISRIPPTKQLSKIYKTHVVFRPHQIGMIFEVGLQYASDKNYTKSFAYFLVNTYIRLNELTYGPGKQKIKYDYFKTKYFENDVSASTRYKYLRTYHVDLLDEILTVLTRIRLIDYYTDTGKIVIKSGRFHMSYTQQIRDPYWRLMLEKYIMPADWSVKRVYLTREFLKFINNFKSIKRAELTMLAILLLQRAPKYKPVTHRILANTIRTDKQRSINLTKLLVEAGFLKVKDAYIFNKNKFNGDVRLNNVTGINGTFQHIGHRSYPLQKLGFSTRLPKGEYELLSCSCLANGRQQSILNTARRIMEERKNRRSTGQPSGLKRSLGPIAKDKSLSTSYNYSNLTRDQIYTPVNEDGYNKTAAASIYQENLNLSSNKPIYAYGPKPLFDDEKLIHRKSRNTLTSIMVSMIDSIFKIIKTEPSSTTIDYRSSIKTTRLINKSEFILNLIKQTLPYRIHDLSNKKPNPNDNLLKSYRKILAITHRISNELHFMKEDNTITEHEFYTGQFKNSYYEFESSSDERGFRNDILRLASLILKTFKSEKGITSKQKILDVLKRYKHKKFRNLYNKRKSTNPFVR